MRHKEYCGCLWLFKSNGLFILPQVLIKTELYPGNGEKTRAKRINMWVDKSSRARNSKT